MRTFAQNPAPGQQSPPATRAVPGAAPVGHRSAESPGPSTAASGAHGSGHHFGRIAVHPRVPLRIQTKLTVNAPGDAFEQEADRAADAVMAGGAEPVGQVSHGVQRRLYRTELRPEDMVDSASPPTRGAEAASPAEAPETEVQRSAIGEAGAVSHGFEQSLQHARGGGEALPAPTRAFMESRFGWDFASVRVHSDGQSHGLARQVNARAFTLENDIFFARSQYQPGSPEGRHLLAHELTHVIQQSEGRLSRQIQRQTPCSRYPGYDASASLGTYNCSGLATRTYLDIGTVPLTHDAIAAHFLTPQSPAGSSCGAGKVKFWLWQYDIRLENDLGFVHSTGTDFHIVAGRTDFTGADPSDVYSKNGYRRVHGPGTGPSWRPAARERALTNDASESPGTIGGRPVFKVRSNMTEQITCAGCHP